MRELIITLVLLTCLSASGQNPVPASAQEGSVLIKDVTIHIGNGREIQEGAIGFKNGKIDFVGSTALAPTGYDQVLIETGKHIYPGFIAVNSTLGIAEIRAVRASQDKKETGRLNPHVRSIIAYNTDSRISPTVRANGVLMAQIAPQGGLISGSSSVVNLDGWNWEDAAYSIDDGIYVNWPKASTWNWQTRQSEPNEDYGEQVNELKRFLRGSQSYCRGTQDPIQLREEACCGLFNGDKRLFIRANYANQMISAIHMAQELGIENLVIVGGYDAHLITDLLKEQKVAVMISGVHGLPMRADDDIDHNFKLAGILHRAGILFCLENSSRMTEMNTMNLPFQAGTCVAHGLNKRDAVSALTLNPAKILGLDDRCGSIEVGKDATLFISTGDALDMRSNHVEKAFIQGRELDLDNHQKFLYRKFKEKYKN